MIKPGTPNLQVDPIEQNPEEKIEPTDDDGLLDEFMSLADFERCFSRVREKNLVVSIPLSTKSKTWQDIERGKDHHDDTQERYF